MHSDKFIFQVIFPNIFAHNHTDIMCTTPQLTLLPDEMDELPQVTHVAAGKTITIGVVGRKKIYIWGNGVGSQYRIPTLLKVEDDPFFSNSQ